MMTYSVVTEKLFSCPRICAEFESRALFGFFMPRNVASTEKNCTFTTDLVFTLYYFSMAYRTR